MPRKLIPLPRLPAAIAKTTANGRTRTYEECYKAAGLRRSPATDRLQTGIDRFRSAQPGSRNSIVVE
jgi:hypothetical protein